MGKQMVRCPRDDRVARLPALIHLLSGTSWIMAVLSRHVSMVPPPPTKSVTVSPVSERIETDYLAPVARGQATPGDLVHRILGELHVAVTAQHGPPSGTSTRRPVPAGTERREIPQAIVRLGVRCQVVVVECAAKAAFPPADALVHLPTAPGRGTVGIVRIFVEIWGEGPPHTRGQRSRRTLRRRTRNAEPLLVFD